MTWYVASCVSAVVVKSGEQRTFPVFEDFFLVSAENHAVARARAESLATLSLRDESLTFEDQPAERIFLGIRKIRSVYNAPPLELDADQPSHGTELTHSYYELKSLDEAKLLAMGKAVSVLYVDDDDGE